MSQGKLWGVPYPLIVFALIAFAAWFVLAKARFGRWIVAIGTEENVSRFSGIPVDRVKIILLTFIIACRLERSAEKAPQVSGFPVPAA